jgi:hypothetical protein
MRLRFTAIGMAIALLVSPAFAAGAYLNDLLKQPAYLASWNALFAGASAPEWVADFAASSDGVVTPSEDLAIGGETYTYASLCQPHDCAANKLGVVFSPDGSAAWALLTEGSATRLLGSPDDAVAAALKQKAAGSN